jgi:hypothetical protein
MNALSKWTVNDTGELEELFQSSSDDGSDEDISLSYESSEDS